MSKLVWDSTPHEFGLDRGVLYPPDAPGVAWNGLITAVESAPGADLRVYYNDGVKVIEEIGGEDFQMTVETFIYPDELDKHIISDEGTLVKSFDMSYRVETDRGHKIHLVYNAVALPSSRSYRTYGDQVNLSPLSFDIVSLPVNIPGAKPAAHVIIDTSEMNSSLVEPLEKILYGDDVTDARMPDVTELVGLFLSQPVLVVTNYGDGSWSAEGPDEAVRVFPDGTFEIDWPSVVYISAEEYVISSM